jgi:hypothetical protein
MISDPNFEGFSAVKGAFLDTIPRARTSTTWHIKRVAHNWVPPELSGKIAPGNDYPCINLIHPAFSRRAVDCLRNLLDPNGEILPLRPKNGDFFAYNLTTVADVLDLENSEVIWTSNKYAVVDITRYEFRGDAIEGLSIFRIPQNPAATYVTDRFVSAVAAHSLGGFDFQIVWPLPSGVSWFALAKEAQQERSRRKPQA